MLETINASIETITTITTVGASLIAAMYLVSSKLTDFFKLFYPSLKRFAVVVTFLVSLILAALLIFGGLVGALIIATLIFGCIIADGGAGKYSSQKAIQEITEDYEPADLDVYYPEDFKK